VQHRARESPSVGSEHDGGVEADRALPRLAVQVDGEVDVGEQPLVRRNDEISLREISALNPERIVISPGPGRPEQAGITLDVIKTFGPTTPLLGVCLGHQAIGMAFGGAVVRAKAPMHGKTSTISHDGKGVFADIASPFVVARYHSLVVDRAGWPEDLEIAAQTEEDGTVMALRHRAFPIHGVQFHPESVMTREGHHLLRNFLSVQ